MGLKRRKIFEKAENKMKETIGMEVDTGRKSRVASPTRRLPLSATPLLLLLSILCSGIEFCHARGPLPPPYPNRDIPLRITPHKLRLHNAPPPRSSGPPPFPPRNNRSPPRDLATAAQTLYDLRGYNIPLGGQEETQRFLRQNDPFSFSRFAPRNNGDAPRTAPLVFPSFYQEQRQQGEEESTTQKRPAPGGPVLNIFGHTQHLSQTKYEPAGVSNGNSALHSQPQTFRPSQIDLGFSRHQQTQTQQHNEVQPSYRSGLYEESEPNLLQGRQVQQPQPQAQAQVQNFGQSRTQNQPQQILNYRAPNQAQQQVGNNGNQPNAKNPSTQDDNSSEEPFIYVYDDEDYEEGEEDFVDKPQQQINTNRVTTPRSQIHFPSNSPSPAAPSPKPSSTLAPSSHHRQPDFFSQIQPQPQSTRDPFSAYNSGGGAGFPPRFSPTITPTPNVEINPSSERKPPPDQSNAITPISLKPNRVVNDDRFRRPQQTPTGNGNTYQQPQQYYSQNQGQNQGQSQGQQRQPFNQVVNLVGEDEDGYEQDPEIIQKLNGFPSYDDQRPETKLRPVNTLVPKNRVPVEEFVLPPNFPFHEDYTPANRVTIPTRPPVPPTPTGPSHNEVSTQANRGDIFRQAFRPVPVQEVSPAPPPPPQQQQHRLRPTSASINSSPSPTPSRVRNPTPTRVTTTNTYFAQEIETEPPKRVRGGSSGRATPPPNKIHTFPPFPNRRTTTPATAPPTTVTTTYRTTPAPRTTTTTTESYEESDEYYDDDEEYTNSNSNSVEGPPTSRQTSKPLSSTPNKSPIRPDFYNNNNNRPQNQIQELHSPKETDDEFISSPPPRRIRPQVTPSSTTPSSPRYYQPTQSSKRFRDQPTIESPPQAVKPGKKTTTGKPLYYAGKMLSKEGGLYAGQVIPLHHVYGKPVPNVPINAVFDRMPAILDGHVTRQRVTSSPQPQVVSPAHVGHQNRIRGREQQKERGVVITSTPTSVRSSTHKNTRLIHPSRIRTHANPPSPPPTEREPERETTRAKPKPRPRTTTTQAPPPPPPQEEEEPEESLPVPAPPQQRRRKVRPGQKKLRQQLLAQEPVVPIAQPIQEDAGNDEDDQDRPEPPRKAFRPKNKNRPKLQSQTQAPIVQILQSQSVSTSSTESSLPVKPIRTGRPRPRPHQLQKQVQILQSQSQSQRTIVEDEGEEVSSPRPRPQKRIRPQKPKFQPQLTPDYSEVISKSVSTQASVKIARKSTEAPNRFSSRFREPEEARVTTSTRSSVSESDHGHDHDHDPESENGDETSLSTPGGLKHFSPPPKSKPRPSFKPPTTKTAKPTLPTQVQTAKPKRIKPKQSQEVVAVAAESDDDLPPSIRLSAKDVVLNRKPARRIPPGSASDRLKALAERRKKIATAQSFREAQSERDEEQEEDNGAAVQEGNRGHRTLRRRKLLNNRKLNANSGEETPATAPETVEFKPVKRRVIKKHRIRPRPQPKEEEEGQDEPEGEKHHDHESDRDFQQNKREITNKHSNRNNKIVDLYSPDEVVGNTDGQDYTVKEYDDIDHPPRALSQRAYERVPYEATSDEARSVVGIVQPVSKPLSEPVQPSYEEGDEDYEGHSSHKSEQKVSTSTQEPFSPASVIQLSSSTLAYEDEYVEDYSPSSSTVSSGSSSTTLPSSTTYSRTTSGTTSGSTTVSTTSTEAAEPSSSTTEGPTSTTTAAYLKARLRPNKKLLASLQPKLSSSQQRTKNESTRHSNLSKLLKFRTSSSTYSPISNLNSKIFTMATEDPSLPLEDMFRKS